MTLFSKSGEVLAHLAPGDVPYLAEAARQLDGGLIVEIGSWQGWSAGVMALNAPKSIVLCIDTWEGSPEHADMKETQTIWDKFRRNARDFANIVGLRMKSTEAAERMVAQIDLLFVDGAHDRESVEADLYAWHRHMKRGGRMLFHDCAPGSGVREALDRSGLVYRVTEPPEAWYIAEVKV